MRARVVLILAKSQMGGKSTTLWMIRENGLDHLTSDEFNSAEDISYLRSLKQPLNVKS